MVSGDIKVLLSTASKKLGLIACFKGSEPEIFCMVNLLDIGYGSKQV